MAIQDLDVRKENTAGFKRKIDDGAMDLVLDTLQVTQYVYPIESTVRELTSNAVDSQKEKENAIKILKGESNPEDFFIYREGEKYKDSNWNSSYYNLDNLDQDNNEVELSYHMGEGTGWCDKFVVKDYGVGIGGERLYGYFQLGFSTKRNRKDALGAFGFGGKVSLATRCPYYEFETVYNGNKFRFKCYSKKVESVIGPFTSDGKVNESIQLAGETIYYERTDSKNYTKITTPCKKTHKEKFIQAVKNQLLYFPQVAFYEHDTEGGEYEYDFKANILHNSENIVIAENSRFSRPHIIITKGGGTKDEVGVCYGLIDFQDLEMEQKFGNIGVKCPIRSVIEQDGKEIVLHEGVSVTPKNNYYF